MCNQSSVSASPLTTFEESQLLVDHVPSHESATASYLFTPPPTVAMRSWELSISSCVIELLVR